MNSEFATPRSAATVIIVRDAPTAPEVFMVRRHSRAVFASHFVFPGGVLDPCDTEVHDRASGVDATTANARLGLQQGALDYYSAAIREAFEESGVLLARTSQGDWALQDLSAEEIVDYRERLHDGSLAWSVFLRQHDLHPLYEALHYVDYWVTPRIEARRFSTRFFLARMPDGQIARHDDSELTDSRWLPAAEVLAAGQRGEMKLMMPTEMNLQHIARQPTMESLLEWARNRATETNIQLPPAFADDTDRFTVVMPGSPDYPDDVDR